MKVSLLLRRCIRGLERTQDLSIDALRAVKTMPIQLTTGLVASSKPPENSARGILRGQRTTRRLDSRTRPIRPRIGFSIEPTCIPVVIERGQDRQRILPPAVVQRVGGKTAQSPML
jgi:hypothetical protein